MSIRVLIGDPDQELLAVFQTYLSGQGFHVVATDNEQQCLHQLREFAPDVLVLELDPARRWGERVVAGMQDRGNSLDVPVIALTHGSVRTAGESTHEPIRASLVKPFSMSELVENIHEIVASPA